MWKRRWVRWLVRTGLLLLLAGVVLPVIERSVRRHNGEEELRAVHARLDAEDRGWRLDDVLAKRNAAIPPDGENITAVAMAAHPKQPQAYRDWAESKPDWLSPPGYNRRPTAEEFEAAKTARDGCRDVIESAKRIRTLASGGYRLEVPPNPLNTLLPHCDRLRGASGLFLLDAQIRVLSGDPDGAVESVHSVLKAAVGIGEPCSMMELLVRLAIAAMADGATEQILGLSEPKRGLAELQAALTAEAATSRFEAALRGERASFDRLLDNLDSGAVGWTEVLGKPGTDWEKMTAGPAFWYYRGSLPADRAKALDLFNALIAASRLPIHERFINLHTVVFPEPGTRYILTRALFPGWNKVEPHDRRTIAKLRSAAAAIACERFRQARGRWPADLAEIPKDILPAVPTDPYTGGPFRFRRTDDGVVIYSTGPDRTDDGGHLSYGMPQTGDDVGFRLWDPAHRSAPPLPQEADR